MILKSKETRIMDILLLLGETNSSVNARTYAQALAQKTRASLAGLAGIDLSFIKARMPGTVGGISYKLKLEEQLRKEAFDVRQRVREMHERECKAHKLTFELLSFEGDAITAIMAAAETRDVIITGHDTAFHGNLRETLPEMISQLVLMTPRPVLVCPDKLPNGHDVLIASDGSLPCTRAIQLFALLGLWKERRIHVTSIDANRDLAARRAESSAVYLRKHGYQVEEYPIASDVHPSQVIQIEVADRKIGTLVMGAYGHRGLRERLFGSTTSSLVEDPRCTLFIYH
jgi:nucleotide-binding universal stress UspA family protein